MRERAGPWIASIHDDLTALFERLDAGTRFTGGTVREGAAASRA
jgi:hypothetical protein